MSPPPAVLDLTVLYQIQANFECEYFDFEKAREKLNELFEMEQSYLERISSLLMQVINEQGRIPEVLKYHRPAREIEH